MKKAVKIGNCYIGGDNPVAVQSMCNARETGDIVGQIRVLAEAGCDIARIAIRDADDAKSIELIKNELADCGIGIPIVADIHFDWRLAVAACEAGADKIRINPGNIGDKTVEVIKACKERGIPIRIGVNSGSVPRRYRDLPLPEAMVRTCEQFVSLFEDNGFFDIVISVKASGVLETIETCRLIDGRFPYPQHLGLTEAGPVFSGTVKSVAALSPLIHEGIGATVRVSLSGDPVTEVKVARELLKALGRISGVTIISCPTCARCSIDVPGIAAALEERLMLCGKPYKIAVMGCSVNGPGEARAADIGVAGMNGKPVLFKNGGILREVTNILDELMAELQGVVV